MRNPNSVRLNGNNYTENTLNVPFKIQENVLLRGNKLDLLCVEILSVFAGGSVIFCEEFSDM